MSELADSCKQTTYLILLFDPVEKEGWLKTSFGLRDVLFFVNSSTLVSLVFLFFQGNDIKLCLLSGVEAGD